MGENLFTYSRHAYPSLAEWLDNDNNHGTQITCASDHDHTSGQYSCENTLAISNKPFINNGNDRGNQFITFDLGKECTLSAEP